MKASFISTNVDSFINEFKSNVSLYLSLFFFFEKLLTLQTGLFIYVFNHSSIHKHDCHCQPQAIVLLSVHDGPWVYNYRMYRTKSFSHCPVSTFSPPVVSQVRVSPSCKTLMKCIHCVLLRIW